MGSGEGSTVRNFIVCTVHLIYLRSLSLEYQDWVGDMARMEDVRIAFNILTGKRPLGRPSRRWEDNIRMNLQETGIKTRN